MAGRSEAGVVAWGCHIRPCRLSFRAFYSKCSWKSLKAFKLKFNIIIPLLYYHLLIWVGLGREKN